MIEVERLRMAVMMRAFYWDAPIRENKRGEWWNLAADSFLRNLTFHLRALATVSPKIPKWDLKRCWLHKYLLPLLFL